MNECELKNSILTYSLPPLSKDEEQRMFKAYKAGNESLKEELFRHNIRFVLYLLDRFYEKNNRISLTYEDLLQEGLLGLLRAIEKKDPENDYRLAPYAKKWIMAYIRKAIYSKDRIIHIPVESLRIYKKSEAGELLTNKQKETAEFVKQMLFVDSTDNPVEVEKESEKGKDLIQFVAQEQLSVESAFLQKELADQLKKEMKLYVQEYYPNNEQKRKITQYTIESYFGFNTERLTADEIAKKVGMSTGGIMSKIYAFIAYCQTRHWIDDYRDCIYQ